MAEGFDELSISLVASVAISGVLLLRFASNSADVPLTGFIFANTVLLALFPVAPSTQMPPFGYTAD